MRILLMLLFGAIGLSLCAKDADSNPCGSILDVDHLTVEEKSKIRAELQQFHASRKINGESVCVQIDFLEQLPPVQKGFTEEGRKIIHRSVYDQWQTERFGQPAVLFLFVKDQQQGKFVLNDMVVSRPVTQRVPNLVRVYIRDEIVKKQTTNYEAISAGIYAFSQALNEEYKERLTTHAPTLVAQKKYHKGYAYDAFDYHYFELAQTDKTVDVGCQELLYSNQFDPVFYKKAPVDYNIPPEKEHTTKIPATVFDFYRSDELVYRNKLQEVINNSAPELVALSPESEPNLYSVSRIPLDRLDYRYEHFDFSSSATQYTSLDDQRIPTALKERLDAIDKNFKQFKDWKFNRKVSPQSPMLFEKYRRKCNARVKVYSGRKEPGDPITMYEGLALSWNERFANAQRTYCDAFASDLSELIFGKKLFGRATSTIEPLMAGSSNFKELPLNWSKRDASFATVWDYVDKGFIVYFVHGGDHIETCYPKGIEGFRTVGAGTLTDVKSLEHSSTIWFMKDMKWDNIAKKHVEGRGVRCFVYFGHLKTNAL